MATHKETPFAVPDADLRSLRRDWRRRLLSGEKCMSLKNGVLIRCALASVAAVLLSLPAASPLKAQERAQGGDAMASAAAGPLLPPNAEPGQCFTRVYVPASYTTETEEILKKEAAETIEVTLPEFETITEEVLIKEESEEIEVVPPSFKEVEEQVLIKPETEELVVIPAQYKQVEEQVLVKPGTSTWQTDCGPIQKISQTTGETLCLIEVPAEYRTIQKRVLESPARTEVVTKPAEYMTITKMVVDSPASTRKVTVPAEYKTVEVRKLVEPAKEIRNPIPEEFETVTKTVKSADARVEWRQILCAANVTDEMVRRVQQALKERGLYRGPVDGAIGPGTLAGLVAFQRAENLPTGQLTTETFEALDIDL
jgi:hypothetical protein